MVVTILIRLNRTPAEYVVQWGLSGKGNEIIDTLKKSRDRLSSTANNIEDALRILTGGELPPKTSVADWQKAFDQKYDSLDKK